MEARGLRYLCQDLCWEGRQIADEREIAADLVPWLIMERAKLSREQAELTVSSLRRRWREGDLGEDVGSPR